MDRVKARSRTAIRLASLLLLSLLVHVALLRSVTGIFGAWNLNIWETPLAVQIVDGDPFEGRVRDPVSPLDVVPPLSTPEPETPEPEEEKRTIIDGQIVETPRPD